MKTIYSALFLSLALFVICGCSGEPTNTAKQEKSGGPVNKICPIEGNAVDEKAVTVEWKGQKIAFCCEPCIPTWNELSDAEKEQKLADAAKAAKEGKGGKMAH